MNTVSGQADGGEGRARKGEAGGRRGEVRGWGCRNGGGRMGEEGGIGAFTTALPSSLSPSSPSPS